MDLSKCSETYYVLRGNPSFDFKLLRSIPLLQGVPKSQLTLNPLAGWSNRNWRLDFQEKSYVLRLAGVGSEQHIDRAAEAENIRIAARLGLTKDALFHDATTGLQLRAFVEGQVLYEQLGMLPEQRIVKIGEILRKLHDSPFPFRNTVNHFAVLKTYQALIQRQRHALSKAYESLFRLMSDIEQRLMPIPFAARPCHNDPNLANFIATSDKTLLLMDWEYSGNGDPAWDFAYVSNYGSFSSEEEALLIQAYELKHDPSFLSRMTVYKPVSEFMFALWIRLQIANAHFPAQREELIEAERLSLQNAEENLSEPSFQNAFQALTQCDALSRPAGVPPDGRSIPFMERFTAHDLTQPSGQGCCVPTVQSRFETQRIRQPDALALQDTRGDLSYRALGSYADALASHLKVHRIGRGARVAVCLVPGIELGIALLGVLKSGASYCPLDPDYPVARQLRTMEDADIAACISFKEAPILRWAQDRQLLTLVSDQLTHFSSTEFPHQEMQTASPEGLVYLIYTSGSTGRPKGVAVSHGNLTGFLQAMQKRLPLSPEDRVLSLTSPAFDIFGLEFFWPLICGASCLFPERRAVQDPEALAAFIEAERPSVMQATPALWRLLVEAGWHSHDRLRIALCGGEAWHLPLAKKLLNRLPAHCKLLNMYGPTETTIWSSCAEITASDHAISLGEPLANTQCYVLDEQLKAQEAGELYIGGSGVANGYWKQPELTAQKFIKDPFSNEQGARMFRTGDKVQRKDGRLLFLGRLDDQVKIRGFRVNLQEIEQQLGALEGVRQAAVLALPREESYELQAHVVPESHCGRFEHWLRTQLALTLPSFMIPSVFHFKTSLPLTQSGKIDRQTLQNQLDPLLSVAEPQESISDPPDRGEQVSADLKTMWQSLLKTQEVERDSGFLELGGHSLLAVQLLSRIRKVFKVPISIPEIMQHLRFSQQVDLILKKQQTLPAYAEKRISESDEEADQTAPSFPLSFSQQELLEIDLKYHAPLVVLSPSAYQIKGPFEVARFRFAVEQLMQRHEMLRTLFEPEKRPPSQRVLDTLRSDIQFEDLSSLPADAIASHLKTRLRQDETRPFKLSQGPLFRFSILKTAPESFMLMMNHHSIIMDGWAKTTFLRELGLAYRAYSLNTFTDIPTQYRQIVAQQQDWLRSEDCQKETTFWKLTLGNKMPEPVTLDFGQTIPAQRSFAGAVERFVIPQDLTQSILDGVRAQGVTLFVFLMTAFFICLSRFSKASELVLSTVVAGREAIELEDAIGVMTNILLLKADLSSDPSLEQLLQRLSRGTLAAMAHQRLPFYHLLDSLGSQHKAYHAFPGNIMLLLQNTPRRVLDFGEAICAQRLPRFPKTAVLDLLFECTLHAQDSEVEVFIEYSTDLYTRTMMHQLFTRYIDCMNCLVRTPLMRLSQLRDSTLQPQRSSKPL